MYPIEQFIELSPPEAHSEDVLSNEHQLMLNRLGFELVERQRFREFPSAAVADSYAHAHVRTSSRLDRRAKELAQEKEELLKTSKSQAATTESVKVQIETLLKVVPTSLSRSKSFLIMAVHSDRVGNRQEGRGAHPRSCKHTPRDVFSQLACQSPMSYLISSILSCTYHPPSIAGIRNYCTQAVMTLMNTKYNLRLKERTVMMICLGRDI